MNVIEAQLIKLRDRKHAEICAWFSRQKRADTARAIIF